MLWAKRVPKAMPEFCPCLGNVKSPFGQLHFNDPAYQSLKLYFEG